LVHGSTFAFSAFMVLFGPHKQMTCLLFSIEKAGELKILR